MSKSTKNGKTAGELKDSVEMIARVYDARKSGASFNEIEQTFKLRPANGMTAYRMVQRAERMKKSK